MRFYLLQDPKWLRAFSAGLILRVDTEIISRTEAGWLNAKLAKILGKQTNQIESKCFLISQNISEKLITLSNIQRAPHGGAAGKSTFHPKETGHTQEMEPGVQPLSAWLSIFPVAGQAEVAYGGGLAAFAGSVSACSCFSLEPKVLNLTINSLLLSSLPNRVVMKN